MMRAALGSLLVVLVACAPAPKESQPPAVSPPPAVVPAESVVRARPASVPTKSKAAPAENRLRDSVTMPIGMVDSNGKFVPLKKRP